MQDGQLTHDKSGRWCAHHNTEHGFLYPCEFYPSEILKEVKLLGIKFREQCKDGTILVTRAGITKTWNEWNKD